jgi:hypothetical protein
MILLLLLTTTTTTNASIVNNIPDCFNGKQWHLYSCIKLCGGMSLTKFVNWPWIAMEKRPRYNFVETQAVSSNPKLFRDAMRCSA